MTIIVATTDATGVVYVASDTLLTDGDTRAGHAQKFIWGPGGRLLALAGWQRTFNVLNVNAPEVFNFTKGAAPDLETYEVVNNVARILFENGYTRAGPQGSEAEPACVDMAGIYITANMIYDVDKSLSFAAHPAHFAVGSGGDFATGALAALQDRHPLYKVITATRVAMDNSVACGGTIDLNIITPLKMTAKKADSFIKKMVKDAGLEQVPDGVTIYMRSFEG